MRGKKKRPLKTMTGKRPQQIHKQGLKSRRFYMQGPREIQMLAGTSHRDGRQRNRIPKLLFERLQQRFGDPSIRAEGKVSSMLLDRAETQERRSATRRNSRFSLRPSARLPRNRGCGEEIGGGRIQKCAGMIVRQVGTCSIERGLPVCPGPVH